ncbi:MAG: FkbM family methyltransferase [Saprospiraceae bacterium]
MYKEELFKKIDEIEQYAKASRFYRLYHTPARYLNAAFFNKLIYPFTRREKHTDITTFFDAKIRIALPAGTDLYLIGAKSHESEIRLARFLMNRLDEGNCFVDVGAHFGYFSLLASMLVGESGKVVVFEAAQKNFSLLQRNCAPFKNIQLYNNAVSDKSEILTFYEFPALYSEYNTVDIAQFENEPWFERYPPQKLEVQSLTLDETLLTLDLESSIIKIDVEGAEFKVISGMIALLEKYPLVIVMEYLNPSRHNTEHQKAAELLRSKGYEQFIILHGGDLQKIADIDKYLLKGNFESDNIVFKKPFER